MDAIDAVLTEAGRLRDGSAGQDEALRELVMSKMPHKRRRRRFVLPVIALGGTLAFVGTGAAIATQWAPWNYVPDEDIVISREWVDVDGRSLGECESRLAANELPADVLSAARSYLARLDTGSLDPDPEVVAALLVAVDRPDRLGDLVAGAEINDFDVTATGPTWDQEWWSDARILQDGLVSVVFAGMADHLVSQWPELDTADSDISSKVQTQCTTDPAGLWQE